MVDITGDGVCPDPGRDGGGLDKRFYFLRSEGVGKRKYSKKTGESEPKVVRLMYFIKVGRWV